MKYGPEKFITLLKAYSKKTAPELCFYHNEDCSKEIIRSHSIQNSFILDQLEENNHLKMLEVKSNGLCCFENVGRNKATTFTGFCKHHDNQIFLPIDFKMTDDLDSISQEQMVLFHFRTLCKEYWAKLNLRKTGKFLKDTVRRKDRLSLLKIYPFLKNEQTINWNFFNNKHFMIGLEGVARGCEDIENYYKSLLYQINKKKFHLTKGIHLKIKSPAQFAVNSAITPVCDFKGNQANDFLAKELNYICLNLFPHKNETHVILTWDRNSNCDRLGSQLSELEGDNQKIQLSKFVLAHSSNIVFSPKLTDELSKRHKESIYKIFIGSELPLPRPINGFTKINKEDIYKIFIELMSSLSFKLDDFEDVNLFLK